MEQEDGADWKNKFSKSEPKRKASQQVTDDDVVVKKVKKVKVVWDNNMYNNVILYI